MKHFLRLLLGLVIVLSLLPVGLLLAQEAGDAPPAEVINDEGGTAIVSGTLTITNPNVFDAVSDPLLILEDQAGFVNRDQSYRLPPASQVIATFTSDFYESEGAITYELLLPILPQGTFVDVDQDAEGEQGVQVYQVGLWDDRFGEVGINDQDQGLGSWSTAYSSARSSINPTTLHELIGGTLIVYASDDQQGFPSGFGADGLLFTADDPIVTLPQGYTVVNMDSDPFTFDRSQRATVDLLEPEGLAPDDFSTMTYTEAFTALVEKAKNEYVYTATKNVDWDALYAEFLPRFEEADANNDLDAYYFAIYDFARAIPDGHVSAGSPVTSDEEDRLIAGGVGLSIRELSDGRVLVIFVQEDGPAAAAGIEYGAEITAVNGVPVEEAIGAVESVNGPYSLSEIERLDQLRFLFRMPLDTQIDVSFINPGGEEQTVTLTAVDERESLAFTRQFVYGASTATFAGPVEYEFLPEGYGYIKVNDFGGNEDLMIENWEYFMFLANASGAPGIIIDLRTNGGGFSFIAERMASYLFREEAELYYDEEYNREIDGFFNDPLGVARIEPPADETLIYDGEVVVLVGPGCASACEYFAYALTYNGRAEVVGQYGSNAIAGGWFPTFMPGDIVFALPTSRGVDFEGNYIIEGVGVQPTIRVPVTEDNMATGLDEADVVLQAAIDYLNEASALEVIEAGAVNLGDTISGTIEPNQRIRYTLAITAADTFSIFLEDETGELDTVLYLYVEGVEEPVLENDDADASTVNSAIEELQGDKDETITIEVATFNDAGSGAYTLRIVDLNADEASAPPAAEATAEPVVTEMPAMEPTAEPAVTEMPAMEPTMEATAESGG